MVELVEGEARLLDLLSLIMVLMGLLSFALLRCIRVPYGRYASSTFGPPVPVRLAWFIQELPSLVVPLYYVSVHPDLPTPALFLMGLFICHYMHRYGDFYYFSNYWNVQLKTKLLFLPMYRATSRLIRSACHFFHQNPQSSLWSDGCTLTHVCLHPPTSDPLKIYGNPYQIAVGFNHFSSGSFSLRYGTALF